MSVSSFRIICDFKLPLSNNELHGDTGAHLNIISQLRHHLENGKEIKQRFLQFPFRCYTIFQEEHLLHDLCAIVYSAILAQEVAFLMSSMERSFILCRV